MWPFDRKSENDRKREQADAAQYRADLREGFRKLTDAHLIMVSLVFLMEFLGLGDCDEDETLVHEMRSRIGMVDH